MVFVYNIGFNFLKFCFEGDFVGIIIGVVSGLVLFMYFIDVVSDVIK